MRPDQAISRASKQCFFADIVLLATCSTSGTNGARGRAMPARNDRVRSITVPARTPRASKLRIDWSVKPSITAHYEVARVGTNRRFLLDLAADRLRSSSCSVRASKLVISFCAFAGFAVGMVTVSKYGNRRRYRSIALT